MEENPPETTEEEASKPPSPHPLPIHLLGSKALRTISKPVGEITEQIRLLADCMVQTMLRAEGIGISACQVGVPIRLIVVSHKNEILRLADPVVKQTEREQEIEEGCLSLPSLRIKVKRPAYILVEAVDVITGSKILVEGTDMEAACLEHEIDHLEGRLLVDKLSKLKQDIYKKKLLKKIKTYDRTKGHEHASEKGVNPTLERTQGPDAYSLCGCGSGKKYKWCCQDGHTNTKEIK